MSKAGERLYNGIIKENPTFVLMLGMCPTLAVTTSAMNGTWYGTYDNGDPCHVKPDDLSYFVKSFRTVCVCRPLSWSWHLS